MNFEFLHNHFPQCTNLTWSEIDSQIQRELKNESCRVLGEGSKLTYLLLDQNSYPPSLSKIHQMMKNERGLKTLHVYTSKVSDGKTFGNHNDTVDVLIVQSIGNMMYNVEGKDLIILKPGDGMIIPKGMYHDPIPIEPRVTLSFSWE